MTPLVGQGKVVDDDQQNIVVQKCPENYDCTSGSNIHSTKDMVVSESTLHKLVEGRFLKTTMFLQLALHCRYRMMKILITYLPPQVVALKKPNKIQADRLSIVSSSALMNDMVGA